MSRAKRNDRPGAIFHVTQRGNNRSHIFSENHEKGILLSMLRKFLARYDTTLLYYVIMDNHYHMVFESGNTPLSTVMRSLNTQYAKWYNFLHNRTGHVFETRYRAFEITSCRKLLRTLRYVAYNPVRAYLADTPELYPWSSHQQMNYLFKPLIDRDRLLELISDRALVSQGKDVSYPTDALVIYRNCIEDPHWSDGSSFPFTVYRHFSPQERLVMLHDHLERMDLDVITSSSDRDLFLVLAMREGISKSCFIAYIKEQLHRQFQ